MKREKKIPERSRSVLGRFYCIRHVFTASFVETVPWFFELTDNTRECKRKTVKMTHRVMVGADCSTLHVSWYLQKNVDSLLS